MAAASARRKGTWRDRLGYYWMYYSIPTILAVIALIAAIGYVHAGVTELPTALHVMLLDAGTAAPDEELAQEFCDAAGIDPQQYTVTIETSLMLSRTTEDYQMASIARLYSDVGTGDLDVVAMRGSDFANYTRADMFLDLREVFSEEALSAFGDLYTDADGQVLGIYCASLPGMETMGAYADEQAVIGIVYNTDHVENAARYLEYLLAQ